MPRVVERDVTRTDAPGWLLEWAELGWVPSCSPVLVGRTRDDVDVLRFVLVVTGSHAAQKPPVPLLAPFRLLPQRQHHRPA